MLNSFYFILGRDVAARFEINTNGLGLACKGTAMLEINKRTMKTDNIRKLVWTNYVANVYKNQDCPGSVTFVFSSCAKEKLHSAHFLTVGCEIGNNIFLGLIRNILCHALLL